MTPTPRPTYTPWPTPTQYVRTNDYFVGDAIYTPEQPSGLQLMFRVSNISDLPALEPDASLAENSEAVYESAFAWQEESLLIEISMQGERSGSGAGDGLLDATVLVVAICEFQLNLGGKLAEREARLQCIDQGRHRCSLSTAFTLSTRGR